MSYNTLHNYNNTLHNYNNTIYDYNVLVILENIFEKIIDTTRELLHIKSINYESRFTTAFIMQ